MRGVIRDLPAAGFHLVCHCDSCTRAQRHFGVEATRGQGVHLYQTTPDRFEIMDGAEHLRLAQLSPKGSYRWYAGCCGSQLGITAKTPRLPFVSVVASILAQPEALGRVRGTAFVPTTGGGARTTGSLAMLTGILRRSLPLWRSGRWRRSVFFDPETGKPVSEPSLLPKDAGRS